MEPKTVRAGLILLIMYDRLQESVFTEKLKGYGYNDIKVCSEGKEALEILERTSPAVIISDVELRGEMNGIETGKKIRDQFDLPLIYMSRLQDENTFQKALDTRPLAFLSKPVNWNELRMAIESAMFTNKVKASKNALSDEYRQWFEKAPLPYQIMDANGNLTAINSAWKELMGYSSDEIIGKWFGDLIPARSHPRLKECLDTMTKEGSIHNYEFELVKNNGHKITVAFEGIVQYGPRKEVLLVQCIINDITEKQSLRYKLEESEERFRQLFEEAPLGYQSLAENGEIIYVNNAWCRMLGYSKNEVIGKWFGDFLAPEERDVFKENFTVFRQQGKAYDINYKMTNKSGDEFYIRIDGLVRYDENGNYIQSHCILKDITTQKLTEDALLASEKKFRNLIESAGDIIYVLDHELKYLYGNKLYLTRHGLNLEELIGKEYRDYHSEERESEFKQKIKAVLESGKPTIYEYQSEKDGRYFLRTISPVIDPETKKFESIIVISKDITRLKDAEVTLRDSEDRYRDLVENSQELICIHDLEGRILSANPWAAKVLGYELDTILQMNIRDFLAPEVRRGAEVYLAKIRKNGTAKGLLLIQTATGERRIWEYNNTLRTEGVTIPVVRGMARDITERKQAEERLHASEERFRGLANSITDVFFALDKDLKYTYWNKASERLTGISEKEAIGKHLREIFPAAPQTRKAEKIYKDVLLKREPQTLINEFTSADKNFIFDISVYPAEEGISVFVKDITERKQTEEKLRESEELYRKIFENSSIGIALTDPDFHFLSANPAFCDMLGYTKEELSNMTFVDITHPDHLQADRENVENMLKGKIPSYRTRKRYIAKNGDILWGNLNTTTIRAQDGKFLYALAMVEDITQRVQSEEKLVQSEERYRQLVELSPDAIMIHQDGKFVFVNKATLELFGAKAPDELIGHPVMERVHQDYRKIVDARVNTIIRDQPNVPLIEEKLIKLDGTVFDAEVTANQISYSNSVAVQVIARNITRRKQTEVALCISQQKLKEAQAIGQIGSWEFDVNHGVIEWSDETYKLYERDPSLGPPTPDEEAGYYTTEQAAMLREYAQRAIETGERFEYDLQARLPSGRTAFFSSKMHPVRDESGRVIRLFGTVQDITGRKQMEEKLRQVLERLDLATSAAHVGIWDWDILKDELVWDEEMYKLYGIRKEDFSGAYEAWLNGLHPGDRAQSDIISKMAQKGKGEYHTEFRVIWPDGSIRHLEAHGEVISDEKGKPLRMIGINMDVTGRKKIETELHDSKQILQTVLDTIPVAVFWKNHDLFYMGGNRTFLKTVGMSSSEEIIGKSDYDLPWDKEQADSYREYDSRIMGTGIPEVGFIEPFTQADGTCSWARTSKVPLRDQEGNVIGILGTYEDITEQLAVEKAFRESKELFEKVFNSQRDAIFILDAKTPPTIIDCNPATMQVFGYNNLEIIGRTTNFLHVDETALRNFQEHLYSAIAEHGFLYISEFEMRRKDGTIFNTENSVMPLEDEKGNCIGWVSVVRDITKRVLAEEALRTSQAQLSNAMEIARLGYWEYDVAEDLFTFDDHFYSIFHTTAEQVGGYTMSSARYTELFVHPEDIDVVRTETLKAIETTDPNYSSQLEHRIIYADGYTGHISVRFYILKDDQGRTVRTFGANQDITDRKMAEIEISEMSEDLSLLADINSLANSGADIPTISQHLSAELVRIYDCNGAAILLLDSTGKSLVLQNLPFDKKQTDRIESLLGQKANKLRIKISSEFMHREMFMAGKVELFTSYDEIHQAVREYTDNPLLKKHIPVLVRLLGIKSMIILPLMSEGKPVGLIEISSKNSFSQNILERLSGLPENLANIITRRQTENTLKSSESRFSAFMKDLPVLIYMKDKDGKFIYGNKAALQFAGRTSETYTGSLIDEFLPGDLAKWMRQMDNNVLKTMKPVDLGEWRWIKDNRERWFREFKFPVILPDGEAIIGGWMMEVTLRKTAESALKESEARHKDLVEKAGIAIMTDDVNGNITFFNREFARLFGYSMAEMKKRSRETLIHTGDIKEEISYHKKRMKGEKVPDHYEIRGIHRNGKVIWIEVTISVLVQQDKIAGTRNFMWDITEKKKTLKALEESETRFRELFNSMSGGVIVYSYDPAKNDFIIKDINRAGMKISQLNKKADVLNKYLLDCFPGARKLGLWSTLNRVRKSGVPENLQNVHYKDDRLDQYVENFVYKLKSGELVAIYDDIGERVLAEQSIWRNYEEIRKLSQHLETIREEERKQIAGELHDELGQILTAVKMDVSWIRNNLPPKSKGIQNRAKSAIQIIDEAIRNIQRISMELRPRMIDDLGLLEALKAYFAEYQKRTNISVRYELPQKELDLLPDLEISVFRIIQEALTNVVRHANASGVTLILKENNDLLELNIQDNGIGIQDEKVHSSESFGILTMRERIQRWGGKFEIKGEQGKGTTINLSIPIIKKR